MVFGLKVKQFRQERSLSFSDLAKATGMSVSYLNEIEKGKKYPKEDKIYLLANALNVSFEELISLELEGSLAPLGELLNSNFLNELPLDLFGIELSKVVEIIANSPVRVGAFISTLVEMSRNYALAEENFYFGVLRSYLELHNNYFEDIEQAIARFVEKYKIPITTKVPVVLLANLLKKQFGYAIVPNGLSHYPELEELRAVFVPAKKRLLLNGKLTEVQKAFQFGKELGFNHLKLKERANTSSLLRVNSFQEALNHFKANYFSAALLINREEFKKDLQDFFDSVRWDGEVLSNLMQKYQASPEMLLQRMTNLIPRFFGLDKLFLLRIIYSPKSADIKVDKELHLNRRHHPHGNGLFEHYCRRWLSVSLPKDLYQMQQEGKYAGAIVGAQISRYFGTDDAYFCITLARPAYPAPDKNVSVTIGILLDDDLRQKVRFLKDPAISVREVNNTCERCPIGDCEERAAPPVVVHSKNRRKKVQQRLRELGG